MRLRWFFSGTVRQAEDMCKHVQKLLNSQRDILSPDAIAGLDQSIADTRAAAASGASREELEKQMAQLEKTANKWVKPYPSPELRENVEVFLVAIVVAMAIRTFFLQPFKIPTGSMEPTLYGIECADLRDKPDFKMPGVVERIWDVLAYGTVYHDIIAPADGRVVQAGPLQHVFHFINKQTIYVQYDGQDGLSPITIWCGPDERLAANSGLDLNASFHKGGPIVEFKETTGDHLFVDRLTYNFRHPRRGDIIVFMTKGIDGIPNPDQFYIKRLIGLPRETVSIGDDRHARIDGKRLDAGTPHFANLYSFDPSAPIRDGKYGQYNGHLLQDRFESSLRTSSDSITVRPHHYLVFGDNTYNSLDSRYWRDLPEKNVVGKAFFVYWPFSSRFGWGQDNKRSASAMTQSYSPGG